MTRSISVEYAVRARIFVPYLYLTLRLQRGLGGPKALRTIYPATSTSGFKVRVSHVHVWDINLGPSEVRRHSKGYLAQGQSETRSYLLRLPFGRPLQPKRRGDITSEVGVRYCELRATRSMCPRAGGTCALHVKGLPVPRRSFGQDRNLQLLQRAQEQVPSR